VVNVHRQVGGQDTGHLHQGTSAVAPPRTGV